MKTWEGRGMRTERKEKERKTLNYYSFYIYTCFGFSTNFVSWNKHQTNKQTTRINENTHLNLMTINLRYIFKHYSIVQFYFSTAILNNNNNNKTNQMWNKNRTKWNETNGSMKRDSALDSRVPINEISRKSLANGASKWRTIWKMSIEWHVAMFGDIFWETSRKTRDILMFARHGTNKKKSNILL